MFTSTFIIAKNRLRYTDVDDDTADISSLSSESLPGSHSFENLYRCLLAKEDVDVQKDEELANILILSSCLEQTERLSREKDDEKWRNKIESWLSKALLPDGKVFTLDENTDDEPRNQLKELEVRRYRYKYSLILTSLSHLLPLKQSSTTNTPSNEALLSLLPFTSPTTPWTTSTSYKLSTTLLSQHEKYLQSPEFIVNYLLQSIIRPIFAKGPQPKTITSSSRKAAPSSAPLPHFNLRENDAANQPWRSTIPYTITILSWIVNACPSQLLKSQAFPLLIPPLLTLLDSTSNSIRLHALTILPTLFPKMSASLLQQTGLGSVFEDAIFPFLLYLPTITPLEDSMRLLPLAYHTLYILADVRWPIDDESSKTNTPTPPNTQLTTSRPATQPTSKPNPRLTFHTRLLRHGLLPAHLHIESTPPLLLILLTQLELLIPRMGISCASNLKDIIPIITNILTDPFLPTSVPDLVLQALRTLRTVILVLWVRMASERWRLTVMGSLSLCWGTVMGDEEDVEMRREGEGIEMERKEKRKEIKHEIRETARVFIVAVRGAAAEDEQTKRKFEEEVEAVMSANEVLREVFGSV